ncbi:MAG: D-glycero-beta-D-manno-heptose 1-phosphate adenylyltransferase [Microcoleaceae cyanobacterium]
MTIPEFPPPVYDLKHLQQDVCANPDKWRPLVLTNGCFDLIHAGHVRYLQTARQMGRSLVVGLNSDASIRQIKPEKPGFPARPITPEAQRSEVLAALKPVDAVVIFSEATATELIRVLQPDIYVKGGDYTVETLPEAPAVLAYGGEIAFVQFEVITSTTDIVSRILQAAHVGS